MVIRVPYRRRELSYDDVGATRRDDLAKNPPEGYRVLEKSARIGSGELVWRRARREVMAWGIQGRSGFRIRGAKGDPRVPLEVGDTVTLGLSFGPVRFRFPARVVYVLDQPERAGFAYGTLPGHAESGEEAFLIERRPDGSIWVVIRAFSRPASPFWRAVDPALRLVQGFYTRRYLQALTGLDGTSTNG